MLVISCHADTGFKAHSLTHRADGVIHGHLDNFAVKAGETLKRGAVIGYVGTTGRATGAHVHYEILANGQLLNPLQLLTQPAIR